MTKQLDRSKRFGVVVGASNGASYHQDGVCFDGQGMEMGGSAPAPAPAPEATATEAPPPPPTEPTPVPEAEPKVTLEELEALHPSQIKKLVEAEGLELVKGPGSKSQNIENLLAAS